MATDRLNAVLAQLKPATGGKSSLDNMYVL